MRQICTMVIGAAISFAAVAFAPAQLGGNKSNDSTPKTKADPRVKTALKEADVKFEINKEGQYAVVLETTPPRSQNVWISSDTEKYGEFEIREVYSFAHKSNGPLTASVANKLLVENGKLKLGAWAEFELEDGSCIVASWREYQQMREGKRWPTRSSLWEIRPTKWRRNSTAKTTNDWHYVRLPSGMNYE